MMMMMMMLSIHAVGFNGERKCADTTGAVLVPWVAISNAKI